MDFGDSQLIITLEVSRVRAGVAVSYIPRIMEEVAVEYALRAISRAAFEQHHQEMVPSKDPADYSVRKDGNHWYLYLRPDHPWWDGPVAHRVSKRSMKYHEAWKQAHRYAEEKGITVLDVHVLEYTIDDYFGEGGDQIRYVPITTKTH